MKVNAQSVALLKKLRKIKFFRAQLTKCSGCDWNGDCYKQYELQALLSLENQPDLYRQ